MPGFRFAETMRGSYHLLADPTDERAMEFTIEASVRGLRRFSRDLNAAIRGRVVMEGFADAPIEGTLGMKVLRERRLPYEFGFVAADGKRYTFRGQKDVTLLDIPGSMTVLPASLYDAEGEEIARATLRFDLRGDIVSFLRSFRPRVL